MPRWLEVYLTFNLKWLNISQQKMYSIASLSFQVGNTLLFLPWISWFEIKERGLRVKRKWTLHVDGPEGPN